MKGKEGKDKLSVEGSHQKTTRSLSARKRGTYLLPGLLASVAREGGEEKGEELLQAV